MTIHIEIMAILVSIIALLLFTTSLVSDETSLFGRFACLFLSLFLVSSLAYTCTPLAKHQNSEFTFAEYEIQQLTVDNVIFENLSHSIKDENIKVDLATQEYSNIVLKTEETYTVRWLCFDVRMTEIEYCIYLEPDIYEQMQRDIILYPGGEEHENMFPRR